jgi:ribosomal protein S27E
LRSKESRAPSREKVGGVDKEAGNAGVRPADEQAAPPTNCQFLRIQLMCPACGNMVHFVLGAPYGGTNTACGYCGKAVLAQAMGFCEKPEFL